MNCNEVLKKITRDLYRKRPCMAPDLRTNYRIEHVNGGLLCDLWFLTVGCMHDAGGGCTMCNYGKGRSHVEWNVIRNELRAIVEKLPWEFEDFLLTPSGSMLDEREVTSEMREDLVDILRGVKSKRFLIETRVDTITDSGLDFLEHVMPFADKYVEIGVESSDDWVLKHCVNKGAAFGQFKEVVKKLHARGICVTANIGIGFPFMSERASIHSAVRSVRDTFEAGADSIVLFPYHVKEGTMLEEMYQQHLYRCVSLWSLVELLNSFSEETLERIQISWYKDYFGKKRSYIQNSPVTCMKCQEVVIKELDAYRDSQNPDVIRRLAAFPCECRERWRKKIETEPEEIQIGQVEEAYRRLARLHTIDESFLDRELHILREEISGGKK